MKWPAARGLVAGRPAAFVLGGLSLVRPLGYAGVPVVVATANSDDPALASRYCDGYVALAGTPHEARFLDAVLAAGERLAQLAGQRVPLFYGTDDILWFLYRHEVALTRYYTMQLNEHEIGYALLDKTKFNQLARERSLPVPRAYCWEGRDGPVLTDAPGAVIVKPKIKDAWHTSPVFRSLLGERGKAMIFATARELLAHPCARELKDLLTVQDYIPGDDDQIFSFHGFADDRGQLLGCFAGRKIRTFPRYTGESSYIEIALNAKDLEASGCEIMERLGLKGVFKMDFKHNPRDGRYYLLEINARFNLWHYLGAVNGVNLPQVAYDYLAYGKCHVRRAAVARYRWLKFSLDYRAFREGHRGGELSVWAWLRSLFGARKVYHRFSLHDPLPFLSRYLPFLRRRKPLWPPTAS